MNLERVSAPRPLSHESDPNGGSSSCDPRSLPGPGRPVLTTVRIGTKMIIIVETRPAGRGLDRRDSTNLPAVSLTSAESPLGYKSGLPNPPSDSEQLEIAIGLPHLRLCDIGLLTRCQGLRDEIGSWNDRETTPSLSEMCESLSWRQRRARSTIRRGL